MKKTSDGSTEAKTMKIKSMRTKSTKAKTMKEKSVKEKARKEKPRKEKPRKEKSMKEKSAKEKAMKPKATGARSMKINATKTGRRDEQAAGMRESWDRRPVSWFKAVLPWIAVLLILLAGYLSVSLVRPLLPDYRGQIVSFEKTERNSPIYLQSDDSIAIYPWDTYDASRMITLSDRIAELYGGDSETEPTAESMGAYYQKLTAESFISLSDFLAPWVGIKSAEIGDIDQAVTCDTGGETVQYYLRDYAVDSNGTAFLTSLFFDVEQNGFFYHYKRNSSEEISTAKISEAHELIRTSIEDIRQLLESLYGDPSQFAIDEEQMEALLAGNPIMRAWYRMIQMSRYLYTDFSEEYLLQMTYAFLKTEYGYGSYDMVVYQGELLVIFTGESGVRMIIFYDPVQDEVSGISMTSSSS